MKKTFLAILMIALLTFTACDSADLILSLLEDDEGVEDLKNTQDIVLNSLRKPKLILDSAAFLLWIPHTGRWDSSGNTFGNIGPNSRSLCS